MSVSCVLLQLARVVSRFAQNSQSKHCSTDEIPSAVPLRPRGQAVHPAVAVRPRVSPYLPALQSAHIVDCGRETLPFEHSVQKVEALEFANLPSTQSRHCSGKVAPETALDFPAAHSLQPVRVATAVAPLYVPWGQLSQPLATEVAPSAIP